MNNFGIFAGKHNISFSNNSEEQNIILIGGLNGRGKTTIYEAILLVLYGKRSPAFLESKLSYSAYLKKYTNTNNPLKDVHIVLDFSIPSDEGLTTLKVKRSWNQNNKIIKDNLTITKESLIDEYLSENWDTFIEEILPVGISSLFFFDGEKISRIAEEDETSETMQAAIKTLLGFDIIDRLKGDLRKIIKKNKVEIGNPELDNEIESAQKHLFDLDNKIALTKQNIAQLKTQQERLENLVREKEQLFLKKGGYLEDTRDNLKSNKEQIQEKLIYGKGSLASHASGFLPLLMNIPLLEQVIKRADNEQANYNIIAVLNHLSCYNQRVITEINKTSLSNREKDSIEKLLLDEELLLKNKMNKNNKLTLSNSAIVLIKDLLSYKQNKDHLKDILDDIEQVKTLEKQLEQIQQHLLIKSGEDSSAMDMLQEIKKVAEKLANIESEVIRLESELNSLLFNKSRLDNELHRLYKEVLKLSDSEEDSKRIVDYALRSVEIMDEFKVRLINKKIASLSEAVTASFQHIIGKKSLISKITIDPNNFSLSINNSIGNVMKSQLSAGERQILALSIMWGLAQVSGCTLPVIIDTPLGRLDSSHRSNFLAHYLPYASHQVIVLSTDEEIVGRYLKIIDKNVQKKYLLEFNEKNNSTKVIEGYFKEKVS